MLFLVIFFTAFPAVLTQDLLGVSYYFDSSYTTSFSEKYCENTTRWELVSYEYLELVPPYQLSSKGIKASGNSCTSSFPIVFFSGTLELTVYVRTISKYSGITVAVFDDGDNAMEAVRYQRSNKNFVTGWTVVSLPIKRHTNGFIRISGQSLNSELIIIDSLRYTPGNTTIFDDTQNTQALEAPATITIVKDISQIEPLEIEFFEVEASGESEEDEDDIDGSGGWETEAPDNQTEDPTYPPDTEEPDNQTEDPIDPPDTEEPENQTEDPGPSTDEPEPEEVVDENSDDPGFWNAFTITLVSVGGFVGVGSIGVGSYYLGKNRGISETPPLDIDALEAPSEITVPRVRSIFSDAPTERFSRLS